MTSLWTELWADAARFFIADFGIGLQLRQRYE
jgi:hypothetical protein